MDGLWIRAVAHRGAMLGAIWAALSAPDPEGLALGLVAVPAAVALSLRLLPARHPLILWRLALHLPRFLAGSVTGGVDVARRAFARKMPLDPGWIDVPPEPSGGLPGGARVALGGELSLMPGTLAAGCDGDRLLVHVLDRGGRFDASIPREAREIAAIIGHRRDRPQGGA
ncbi:Na+/H+ antiporter subunit E [Pararhodobacter sp. SW119]|uniref:Na+/H+ antiporter subunit E n=1 Tax=Pararhodobacter sp. SW119 TaxID=2780075 RepID=UPI001AE06EAA|nr:Na+/H+ antiporter subunit E [Pararhodobacter sp. SW119]